MKATSLSTGITPNDSISPAVRSRISLLEAAITSAALNALIRSTPSSAALSNADFAPAAPLRKSMSISLSTMRSFMPSPHPDPPPSRGRGLIRPAFPLRGGGGY